MGMFDNVLKRHEPDSNNSDYKRNNSDEVARKAKALIDELVSPLSVPNQRIIDEVLMIIRQSASLPDSMVNKAEVQNITKQLLFNLVEPISNPNKKLIDDLLKIVAGEQLSEPSGPAVVRDQKDSATNQYIRINRGLAEQKSLAMGDAPYPVDSQRIQRDNAVSSSKHDKETRSVMNLILEQIKEVIEITNNLNSKLKSHQIRLDAYDASISEIKKRAMEVDEKMAIFEKNMEKFVGLYEVVTNQYNPFVDSSDSYMYDQKNNHRNSTNSNFQQGFSMTSSVPDKKIVMVEEVKPFILSVAGRDINFVEDFTDQIIMLDDSLFDVQVLKNRDTILKYFRERFNMDLTDIFNMTDRISFVKAYMKKIHS